MGHRNTQFTGHMIAPETDQQGGHSHLHPEPCLYYGTIPNFPQPNNIHPIVSAPGGNPCNNFNFPRMPEYYENALFHGIPPYNPIQPQHPSANLELSSGAPSGHYTPYMAPPPSGFRDFPGHYGRHISYMDDARGQFKRKINAEGPPPANFQFYTASAGPSSSVAPRPAESDVIDAAPFMPPEAGVEGGSIGSVRSRPSVYGPESVLAHNPTGHLIHVAPHVQLPGNPWMDMQFGTNNGDVGNFAWGQPPNLSYMHANGTCIESGNIGMHCYQIPSNNRSSTGFLHPPPIPQGLSNPHHPGQQPMQGVRGYGVNNFPSSQAAISSRRIPPISSSNVVDGGPTFLPPVPQMGFRVYRPGREILLDHNARHRILPHLRMLPEDEVAILEIPGYHEVGDSFDHHREMRLDIDHMSYEELLALGEQIGHVGTGLSEEFIERNLKSRTFSKSEAPLDLGDATCSDQPMNFCVICQMDYEDKENICLVDCGHEYHRECVKKWLRVKNTCPVCKSTALSSKGKKIH